MQSSYVVHAIEGRARLRHPALADVRARGEAQALLRDEKGVNEVRFGSESLLLLMNPGTDFAAICQRLEEKIGTQAKATPLQHSYGGDFCMGRNP